jgi:uncharacterized protein (UPF0332 family)
MTWKELADCQHAAARHLRAAMVQGFDRAICSRAYYAVYALITSRLPAGISLGRGWQNPQHANLPKYVARISNLDDDERRAVKTALNRLRTRREYADYHAGITVDNRSARESMRDAAEVYRILAPEY